MENRLELGSEFNISLNELQIKKDNLFEYFKDYTIQWYDYGRSAVRNIPIKKGCTVLLPEFICKSVIECFDSENIRFYEIDRQFNINIQDLMSKLDEKVGCIYIAHYFGYLQSEENLIAINEYKTSHDVVVIEDITQSVLSEHNYIGDYIVASIRKWLPTPMGALLYAKSGRLPSLNQYENNDNTKAYGMILKDLFLKTDYDTNSKYREIFRNTELRIESNTQISKISDFASFCISCSSVSDIKRKRVENVERLENGLKSIGIESVRKFKQNEIPLVYPVRIKKRDEFRAYLMENRVYCAIHWPFDGIKSADRQNALYNSQTLLSLPIDQRYGDKEIDYMIEIIRKYGGELEF